MACTCTSAVRGGDTLVRGTGNISVSGSGTATDPYIVAVATNEDALAFTVQDTATVNLQLTGSGTAADPFVLRADTSSATQLRGLGDVAATPVATQGTVPMWIGTTAGGHFELRNPGVKYTTSLTRGSGDYQGQMARDTDTQKRYEWDGSQWIALDVAIPSNSLDPGVMQNGGSLDASTDWNTLTAQSRQYRIGNGVSSTNNSPAGAYGYGTLVVFTSGQSVTQVYYTHGTNITYTRTKWNAADWTGWSNGGADQIASLSNTLNSEQQQRAAQDQNLQNQINTKVDGNYVSNAIGGISNDTENRINNRGLYTIASGGIAGVAGGQTVQVNYPGGRFNNTPTVVTGIYTGADLAQVVGLVNNTSSGVQLHYYRGGQTSTATITWIAVQTY